MVEKQNVELKLIHMEDVVSKEVEWLWYPYIPYGKITIVEGDPGEGKTTLVLKLAAALSRGLPLPCDDDKEYEPMARDLQEILRIGAEQKRLWEVYEGR